MSLSAQSSHRLLKTFRESFTALDIYEPLHADASYEDFTTIDGKTGFADIIETLMHESPIYVHDNNAVLGFITKRTLEAAPFRMWLYGIISLMEMNITDAIRRLYPDDAWVSELTDERIEAAKELQANRAQSHQSVSLIECLTFTDKLNILFKDEERRVGYGMDSRKSAKWAVNHIVGLRNSLAHSHPIIEDHWDIITKLTPTLNSIITGNPEDDLQSS